MGPVKSIAAAMPAKISVSQLMIFAATTS